MPQVHRRVQKSTKSNAKNCLSFSARLILYWQTRQSWGIVAQPALKHKEPTRLSAGIFSLKAAGLRGKRFVTDRKRPLLRFATGKKADYPTLLAGIPVIATPHCGLENLPNLTIVPAGDVEALQKALSNILNF